MEKQISSWSVTFLLHDPWWHLTWIRIRLFILVDLIPEIQNSIWKTDKILDEISFRIFYWKLKTVPDPGSGPMIFMDTEPTGWALWRVHAKAGLPKHWDINVRLNYSLELTVKIMKQSVENVDLGDSSPQHPQHWSQSQEGEVASSSSSDKANWKRFACLQTMFNSLQLKTCLPKSPLTPESSRIT